MKTIKRHTNLHLIALLCLLNFIIIPNNIHSQNKIAPSKTQTQSSIDSSSMLSEANMPLFFKNPPLVYKLRPLWFWNNTTITSAGIIDQMQQSKDNSGYGGFGILPFGKNLMPKYLSTDYFNLYEVAVKKAHELGQKLCIYDEYGFPSGSGGGINGDGVNRFMNKHPDATIKRLDKWEELISGPKSYSKSVPSGTLMSIVAMDTLSKTRIDLTNSVQNGNLTWNVPAGVWRIMIFVCVKDGDPNVDYLDPDATDKFIEMVHQVYYDRFKEFFGTTIDGVFFDEPTMYRAAGRIWTPKYNEKFQAAYGFNPSEYYPALWYDIGPETQAARNFLFGFRSELYAGGFMKRTQDWCDAHGGISSTGHQDNEDTKNPVSVSGDLMKCHKYQNIPGIDKISGGATRPAEKYYKIISSSAYNWDKSLVMSETYGDMGNISWNDIYAVAMEQYSKGINMLIPHAVWYNNANVTFLPELSYRSPIYSAQLPVFNKFLGRLNVMLQNDGRHVADIGVLYPISTLQGSHYLDGPLGYYAGGVSMPEDNYADLGEMLSTDVCRDFTWIHPDILDERCTLSNNALKLNNTLNHAEFKIVVVPGHKTIRWSNLKKIKQLYDHGGKVIFTGTLPTKSAEFGHDQDVTNTIQELFPDVSKGVTITASSQWAAGGYDPEKAGDGLKDTRWNAADKLGANQWLEVDFGRNVDFNKTIVSESFNRTTSYNIQYWNGSVWINCATGSTLGANKVDSFNTVNASKVRLYINSITAESVSINEFEVHLNQGPNLVTAYSIHVKQNAAGGRAIYMMRTPKVETLRNALDSMLKTFDVKIENNAKLRYIHKVKDSIDIFYFANTSAIPFDGYVRLRANFTPKIWDPHTGEITDATYTVVSEGEEKITRVKITLPAYRSCFVVSPIDGLLNDNTPLKASNNTFEICPNPMNQFLTIKFKENLFKKLIITDITDKTVMTFNVSGQSSNMQIDVSNLGKGIYCVTLLGSNSTSSKLVIR